MSARPQAERCPTCGAHIVDTEERAAAEIILANIMALMRQPSAMSQVERVLRHLGGMRAGVARLIGLEEERAARGR